MAFAGLDAPDALELPGKAPDPAKAAKLTRAQVSAALKRARRRDIPGKATAGTSPITRAPGKKKIVAARFIRNDRLIDALMAQAMSALGASPGGRALYDAERASGTEHNAALRKLASRLVGILHGCLKTRTLYDEAIAWPHREKTPQSDIAA